MAPFFLLRWLIGFHALLRNENTATPICLFDGPHMAGLIEAL